MSAVREAFRAQAVTSTRMGSPFTARLCALAADRLAPVGAVAERVLGWPSDPSQNGDALPLRLAGALHALVLEGAEPALAAVYPPNAADDGALWRAVDAAMDDHAPFILARLESAPQTNEAQRSAALAPGYMAVAVETGLPLICSEIGASAGLNLIWDRYAYDFGGALWGDPDSHVRLAPDWTGPSPPLVPVVVAGRAGCDVAAIDAADRAAENRLLSYIWPDQTGRLARARAALTLARAEGVRIERIDAADWLEGRLAEARSGHAHVVAHSIMWQYMPVAWRDRVGDLIGEAGARATCDAPLAWMRLEPDGGEPPGAALSLTLWPGGETTILARAGFHGEWVDWHPSGGRPA